MDGLINGWRGRGTFGTGIVEDGFPWRVALDRLQWIESGGRRLDRGLTEVGSRFDGRKGGEMLHS